MVSPGRKQTDKPSVVPLGRQNLASALIAADVRLFKFDKTNLNATVTILPALSEPGRVRLDANATYYIKLFSNLSWNVSFYGNWDNQPPPGFSRKRLWQQFGAELDIWH